MYRSVTTAELEAMSRESQFVECKKSLAQRRAACEALSGMLNTEKGEGRVLFGIAPDGSICGVEAGNLDTAQRGLVQHVHGTLAPTSAVSLEVLTCDGRFVGVLSAQRPRTVAVVEYDGRAFIREGSATRRLTLEEKRDLQLRRNRGTHTGPWRCDRCRSITGFLMQTTITDKGALRSYRCTCGGEFWPIT